MRPSPAPRGPSQQESVIDEALDQALGKGPGGPSVSELPLKRQWDAELEAEMEAALTGFDPKTFRHRPGAAQDHRPRRGPERDRGQEARKGTRTGKVISIRGRSMFVDLGGKSEGVIPLDQFEGEIPAPGTRSRSSSITSTPARASSTCGSREPRSTRPGRTSARESSSRPSGTKVIKGGLEVDVDGIRGFMPISQIDFSRIEDAAPFVNQKFKALVTEANSREKNLVISPADLLEQERAELREKTWAELAEGQVREGTIRSIKDFGAFVDLGGVDGLLPIGEMSWSRVQKVEDLVKTGDKVQVKIIKIDPVARKLTLGLKQLTPSPWERPSRSTPAD